CARCALHFVPSQAAAPPSAQGSPLDDSALLGLVKDPESERLAPGLRSLDSAGVAPPRGFPEILRGVLEPGSGNKHSGLGIASFIIAFLVGGLDMLMAVAITASIARSGQHWQQEVMSGSVAMICLNCMSLPVC